MSEDEGAGSRDAGTQAQPRPAPPPEARAAALPPAPGRSPRRVRTGMAIAIAVLVLAGVAVAVSVARSGGATDTPSSSPAASASAASLAAPTGLEAKAAGPYKVVLTWDTTSSASGLLTVIRNGDVVASLPGSSSHWTDKNAVPTERYRYAVRAVGPNGEGSSPATTVVKLPKAPAGDARLEGVYEVTLVVTSKYGYSAFPAKSKQGWRFEPVCHEGACDVQWEDTAAHDLAARLNRTSATYKGSASAKFNTKCSGVDVSSSMTLDLHVTRADAIGDAWRATEFRGTALERTSAQLGCAAAGINYSVQAKLYR